MEDARALLEAGRWAGAYYMIGYAVECALKAAIARRTKEFDFPDKHVANEAWSHRPGQLLKLTDTKPPPQDSKLGLHWEAVRDWNEESRYEQRSRPEAKQLFEAVTDPVDGVLQWIRSFW